jgi:hypothetical protein
MLCECVHAVARVCGTELDRVRDMQIDEDEVLHVHTNNFTIHVWACKIACAVRLRKSTQDIY